MESGQVFEERFRVQHEVGRGTFGIVYRVEDLETGQPRAVKFLHPWAQRDDALRRRLKREAKYTRSFHSPHIVRIDRAAETGDGDLYTVMEFVEGRELSDALAEEGPFAPDRVTAIGEQILDALADAHAAGIVHRDLKPHNVFLCRDEQGRDFVKVFDFGIAKASEESGLTSSAGKLTMAGGVLGTPVYMSPEQCHGDDLTPASDLYALGVVLYELLTGRVPFDDENPVRVMLMHATQPVPPLPADVADTPLGRAVMRALEKDPRRRFTSAEEFRAALRGEAPSAAKAGTNGDVAAKPAPVQMPQRPAATAPRPAPVRRFSLAAAVQRYWLPVLILALALVVVASQFL